MATEFQKNSFKTMLPVFLPSPEARNWDEVQGFAEVTEDGEVIVRLKNKDDAVKLAQEFQQGILVQVAFDYKMPVEKVKAIQKRYEEKSDNASRG